MAISSAYSFADDLQSQKLVAFLPAAIACLGWLALYGPVYFDFAQTVWHEEQNAHAPFILAIIVGSVWAVLSSNRFQTDTSRQDLIAGFAALCGGLFIFWAGRMTDATIAVSASQSVVFAGLILVLFGRHGLKKLWFPILMTSYLIVWPGWALDALTAPLKQWISLGVSDVLYAAGLPVAHAGTVITAGQYHLLVADACAGLNSLIALTAVGAVYLRVIKRDSLAVNALVLASLIPIAIMANFIRVLILVLITYYGGYDAGQGFLHEGAGLTMFVVSLSCVFLLDSVAEKIFGERARGE